jgi:hypothetical protein
MMSKTMVIPSSVQEIPSSTWEYDVLFPNSFKLQGMRKHKSPNTCHIINPVKTYREPSSLIAKHASTPPLNKKAQIGP